MWLFMLNYNLIRAQNIILAQSQQKIYLYNIDVNSTYTLTNQFEGALIGYEVKGSKLYCFSEKNGNISKVSFKIPFNKIPVYIDFQKMEKETQIQKYAFDEYILLVFKYCLVLCKNGTEIWKAGNTKDKCPECNETNNMPMKFLSIIPILSPDKKNIMYVASKWDIFSSWNKIFEIDINTGRENYILKGSDPTYSFDSRYILFKLYKNNCFCIYDKKFDKRLNNYYQKALWLYRKSD